MLRDKRLDSNHVEAGESCLVWPVQVVQSIQHLQLQVVVDRDGPTNKLTTD